MKIYGHYMSAPANQVRLTASALGVLHDYVHVELSKGEQKQPSFLAINPFGKVPAMQDGDLALAESGAICRYLACRDGGASGLYPADVKVRAKIDQWMDCAAQNVRMQVGKVLFNKMFAPIMGKPVDEKAMADGREQLAVALTTIDAELAGHPYLVGATLSLADIAMAAALEPAEMIGFELAPFPHVRKWRDAIMAADFYRRVHAHYGAEMRG